ncbi:MAG: hypothetical protein IAF38_08105, partial [Bacteroidia bacterium]|nr:hypothetical protein [Bacteroidia bacterium]
MSVINAIRTGLISLILFSFFSCGSRKGGGKTEEIKGIEITRSDAGKTISLKQNDLVKLKLSECIGCDPSKYAWEILKIDSAVVKIANIEFKSSACTDCDGGYGLKTYSLLAKEKGNTEFVIAILND